MSNDEDSLLVVIGLELADEFGRLARNEFDPNGPLELKRVEEKFVRTAMVMELTIEGQSIKTTAEHPFFVPSRQTFVAAGELQPGDMLVSHDGRLIELASVSSTDDVTTVYNLRVADHHTYFVGCDEWGFSVWAHNRYGNLPDAADPKHTVFRELLETHDYKEIKGKIFKNGQEIGQAHIEELTGLYQRELASGVSPTIDRITSGAPNNPR